MAHVTEVRRALAAKLDHLGNVTVYPGRTDYPTDNGLEQRFYIARVLVGPEKDPDSAERLDELLSPGPESLKALVEADHRLGGLVSDVAVARSSGYLTFPGDPAKPGDSALLGAEWTIATQV